MGSLFCTPVVVLMLHPCISRHLKLCVVHKVSSALQPTVYQKKQIHSSTTNSYYSTNTYRLYNWVSNRAYIQGDPREPYIFWMGSTQNCAEEESTVPMCGFNKMVPQRTLQTSQWPLFETCFPGTSFPVSEMCRGPLALPIFQSVIFFFGGIWNHVFTLTNPVGWMIWRKPSVGKFDRSSVVGPCHGRF